MESEPPSSVATRVFCVSDLRVEAHTDLLARHTLRPPSLLGSGFLGVSGPSGGGEMDRGDGVGVPSWSCKDISSAAGSRPVLMGPNSLIG